LTKGIEPYNIENEFQFRFEDTRLRTQAREIFDRYIRASGLKGTTQRIFVLDAFLDARKHVSIEDLHRILAGRNRRVGYVTVYRTMKLIADSGLAREVVFDDGVSRFEPVLDRKHHHHLVCKRCGKVIEFSSETLEKMERELLKKYNFDSHSHHYEIFGLCSQCRGKN
jgi:Fur family ferric uptake transcriptional regulator